MYFSLMSFIREELLRGHHSEGAELQAWEKWREGWKRERERERERESESESEFGFGLYPHYTQTSHMMMVN